MDPRAQFLTRLENLAIFLAPATNSRWRKPGYVIADGLCQHLDCGRSDRILPPAVSQPRSMSSLATQSRKGFVLGEHEGKTDANTYAQRVHHKITDPGVTTRNAQLD